MPTTFSPTKNIDFESLIAQQHPGPLAPHIPKVAHYIHSKVQNLTWIDYAVVCSAFVYVGVEKVKIWVPEDVELPGEIWGRLQRMEGVEVVRIVMPEVVWGVKVRAIQHWSDLARIRILWEEGGIYFDNDVLALKSSDDIIYSNKTRATVMPRQHISPNTAANSVIMSKPHSPFLRRWMERYKDYKPTEWDHTSCTVPVEMWDAGELDLILLEEHAWMYPMVRHPGERESLTDPMLATMWVGKSWWDIERSYGTHMWKWGYSKLPRQVDITAELVRDVDTPILCKIRSLFDDLDGDGYRSVPAKQNPNRTATWMRDIRAGEPFSDYQIVEDTTDVK